MSFSFRLRYFLGLIPTAQKIDSARIGLFRMRDELHLIETSKELARYNELNNLIQSNDFQAKKNDIINLNIIGSAEHKLLIERANLEHSKPIKDDFRFIQSPDFILRKKEAESLRYKDSPEYRKRNDFNALQRSAQIKRYYATRSSDQYRLFLELDVTEKGKLDDHTKKKDLKLKIYRKYLNSSAYKNNARFCAI